MAMLEQEIGYEKAPEPGDQFWSVYMTKASLYREAQKRRAMAETFQDVKTSLLTAAPGTKIWDLQRELEQADPSRADIVYIIMGELEDRFIDVNDDGTFRLRSTQE